MTHEHQCDDVFEILTRAPFPGGSRREEQARVESHLAVCHSCRKLAEALRPATDLFHEVLMADVGLEDEDLPAYRGTPTVVDRRMCMLVPPLLAEGTLGAPAQSVVVGSDWGRAWPAVALLLLVLVGVRWRGGTTEQRAGSPMAAAPFSAVPLSSLPLGARAELTEPVCILAALERAPACRTRDWQARSQFGSHNIPASPRSSSVWLPLPPAGSGTDLQSCQRCHAVERELSADAAVLCCTHCHQANSALALAAPVAIQKLVHACEACHL